MCSLKILLINNEPNSEDLGLIPDAEEYGLPSGCLQIQNLKKKQKKSLHPPGGELLSAMQVPSDLAFGEPVVTFYGGREVQIENYRRILEYNACRLCVLTQYGRLLLVGEGIRIVSYSGEEMRVEGRIDQVTFQ